MKYFSSTLLIVAMTAIVTACGGSSSQGPISSIPPPPLSPPPATGQNPSDFETTEYNADWSLAAIGASGAYARGFTGEGAIVGFVDFNFELSNTEVDWHSLSADKDQQWIDMYEAFLGVDASTSDHGQWVSTIAAAQKNDVGIHGVAFDAEVIAVDFFAGVDRHIQVQDGVTYHVSDPWGYVVNNGARVVNKSIGYDEEDIIPNPPATNGNEHYTTTNAARVVELGGLLVAAAGNDGDPDPMLSNIETLDTINDNNFWTSGGYFLVVGSLNEAGTISDFSDRAGVLKDYFLVAPGEDVAVSSSALAQFGIGSGTSFAAPHVVGAAALLFGQWPQLEAFEVADILLSTATDLGAVGVDAIYGHGLLNIDEATKPTGQTSAAVEGGKVPLAIGASMMVMGPAFGDARPENLASVMILDDYDRDYYIDARAAVLSTPNSLNFSGILDLRRSQMGGGWQLNSGLKVNMVMNQDSQSRDAHRDTLTDLEKSNRQYELRSWSFVGDIDRNSQWAMGQGYNISRALNMVDHMSHSNQDIFLGGYGRNNFSSPHNFFMAGARTLGTRDQLSIGVMIGKNRGQGHHAQALFQDDLPRYAIESRLTHHFDGGGISMALGAVLEEKAVLGSRSHSAFALADQTATGTMSIKVVTSVGNIFGKQWDASAIVTGGMSNVTISQASLFKGFNQFMSTEWAVSLATDELLTKGDQFGFSVSQALRVENATVLVSTATHFDIALDAPAFISQRLNLTPSGREISLEAAYHVQKGHWSMSTNLIRRFNLGHISQLNDIAVLFSTSRIF